VSQMKVDTLILPLSATSDGKNYCRFYWKISSEMVYLVFNSLNTIIINEKIESSEPCWDGYQVNKLY
jgi:hypothetical protein